MGGDELVRRGWSLVRLPDCDGGIGQRNSPQKMYLDDLYSPARERRNKRPDSDV